MKINQADIELVKPQSSVEYSCRVTHTAVRFSNEPQICMFLYLLNGNLSNETRDPRYSDFRFDFCLFILPIIKLSFMTKSSLENLNNIIRE